MKNKYLSLLLATTLIIGTIFLSACTSEKEEETFTVGETVSAEKAREIAEDFINDYLMMDETKVTVRLHGSAYNMYHLKVDLGTGEQIDSFITKDGKLFFPQHLEIEEIINMALNQGEMDDSNIPISTEPLTLDDDFFESNSKVTVYFFGTDTCPYCKEQKEAMIEWRERFSDSDLEIKEFATENEGVMDILIQLASQYNTNYEGVPMTFIDSEFWIGYSKGLGNEMIEKIEYCLTTDCENPGERLRQ
jgi:glutaredoxin